MLTRILSIWLGALALVLTVILPASALDSEGRPIIAVGDVHGDWDAYYSILTEAGLVDADGDWAGEDTILVQVGDIPDRGPDTRRIIEHIRKLQDQAERDDGEVIVLVGNHEAMMMTGDVRYVHPGEYAAFVTDRSERLRQRTFDANAERLQAAYRAQDPDLSDEAIRALWYEEYPLGRLEHQEAWSPDGEIGKWVARNPAVVRIDDYLFVHAGLDPAYIERSIKQINRDVKRALRRQNADPEAIINASNGPLWHRGWTNDAAEADPVAVDAFGSVLSAFEAERMIVGHTPSRSGIRTRFDGRLIQIDTGASAHYGGIRSFLRIEDGRIYAHDAGVVTPL